MRKMGDGCFRESLRRRFEEAEGRNMWLHPNSSTERSALSRGLASKACVEPVRGLYARGEDFNRLSKRAKVLRTIRTLSSLHPRWTFCLFSAAVVHGFQVPYALLGETHVLGAYGNMAERPVARRHQYRVAEGDVGECGGIPVTSARRTLLDCLCAATFRQGLAIMDSAMRWSHVEKAEMESYCATVGRSRKGVATARRVLEYADGRSENGGESMARAVMIELGFKVPLLQVEVVDPVEPTVSRRVDFYWEVPGVGRIVGELDGMGKYVGDDCGGGGPADGVEHAVRVLSKERIRESHISLSGAKVVRFTFDQAMDERYFERLLLTAGVPRER